MSAVALLVRAELRRRWGSLLVVALLVVLAGGVTLAAVAGARRTSTSFERFQDATLNHDVLLFAEGVQRADVERLRAMDGVAGIGYLRQLAMVRPDGDFLALGGPLDDAMFRDVARLRIVEGRLPDPEDPSEVVVPEPLARITGLEVGDSFLVRGFTQAQLDELGGDRVDTPAPEGPVVRLRVVGVSRLPIDLSLQGRAGGVLAVQRSFVERYGPQIGNFSGEDGAVLIVRLRDGADGVDRFLAQLRTVLGDRRYDVDPTALTIGGIEESIDVLALGVAAFGAIAGIAGTIAIALIVSRQVALLAASQAGTRELGMTRRRRALAIAVPLLVAVGAGTVAAVLAAWLLSPLTPFGVAGRAEPDPGLQFDVGVLLVGGLLVFVLLGTLTALMSWRAAGPRLAAETRRRRPSAVARALVALGLAPPATVGVGMALEPGRGRTAVPVRSSLVGAAVAVLGVAAVAVFAASLDGLVASPHAYGVNWDRLVDDTRMDVQGDKYCGEIETRLTEERALDAVATVCSASITVDGRSLGALGFRSLRGEIGPTVLDGRAPRAEDEVALGSETMDALGISIGDRVVAETSIGEARYRVVGRVVIPSLVDPQAVADGAVFTGDGLALLEEPQNVSIAVAPVIRFRPGADVAAASRRIAALPGVGRQGRSGVERIEVPLEVERLQQVDRIPIALAIFLTVLGALAVGHLLVTSVHRRARDFAVLKALGFRRRQTYATVGAQATTVAVVGVVVGTVLGVALGAVLWRAAAARVGVLGQVDFPIPALAVVALGSVVVANLIAAIPAHTAARTRPADVFRRD